MFYSIKGELCRKFRDKVLLRTVDGTVYQIFTPETVYHRIDDCIVNGYVELFIYYYLDMQQNRAFPVLVGFLNELEKDFFEVIISVSGIGPKAAVRALKYPASEIAEAIEKSDLTYLKKLPGIGLQKAKNIIAALQGKMSRFLLLQDKVSIEDTKEIDISSELVSEAQAVLAQLQYNKKEASAMIDKALKAEDEIKDLEALLSAIYKQHNTVR